MTLAPPHCTCEVSIAGRPCPIHALTPPAPPVLTAAEIAVVVNPIAAGPFKDRVLAALAAPPPDAGLVALVRTPPTVRRNAEDTAWLVEHRHGDRFVDIDIFDDGDVIVSRGGKNDRAQSWRAPAALPASTPAVPVESCNYCGTPPKCPPGECDQSIPPAVSAPPVTPEMPQIQVGDTVACADNDIIDSQEWADRLNDPRWAGSVYEITRGGRIIWRKAEAP